MPRLSGRGFLAGGSRTAPTCRGIGRQARHHELNPGGLSLEVALDLSLPTWAARGIRPRLHLSSQDPAKQAGAHAYSVDSRDWQALLGSIGGREADVMVEAKGQEYALAPMRVKIV